MTFTDEESRKQGDPTVKLIQQGYKSLPANSFQSAEICFGTLLDPQDLHTLKHRNKEVWALEKQNFCGSFSLISK